MGERPPLESLIEQEYPFQVIASEDGGYVITFPDLPGCITQVETSAEIVPMAEDARRSWITSAYEDGQSIPPPTRGAAYSGKFLVRLPRSLHRELAEQAAREGVSLNQYVVALLTQRHSSRGLPVG